MRIGVDARLLSKPLTGIGRYIKEMCSALVEEDAELVLFSPSCINSKLFLNKKNIKILSSNQKYKIGQFVWTQTLLPYLLREQNLDIFWGPAHRLPSILPRNLPRVVTIHDLVWKYHPDTMPRINRVAEKILMPAALHTADQVLVDSYSTLYGIEEYFPEIKSKSHVVHLGNSMLPHPEDKSCLKSLGIDAPYWLFVGTLEPRKNLARLLAAYASLPDNILKNFQFVIVGGKGWGQVNIQNYLRDFDISISQIKVLGYISDQQLSTLYAHAEFFAMPSLYEGFGIPVIEAMSFGTPVMTSNCSSLPEVAGDAAVLVDPYDISSMAEGIKTLLTDDNLKQSLSNKSKINANNFTWKKSAKLSLEIFDCAIKDRNNIRNR